MRRDRVGDSAGYAAAQDGDAQPDVRDSTDRVVQFSRSAADEAAAGEIIRFLDAVVRPASARFETKLDAGSRRYHADLLAGCCLAPLGPGWLRETARAGKQCPRCQAAE